MRNLGLARGRGGWLTLVAALLAVPPAQAENLLLNGGFDGGLAPWSTHGNVTFSSVDADGSASSGSARLVTVDEVVAEVTQCVEVPAGVDFLQLDARVKSLPTLDNPLLRFDFSFVLQPGCVGSPAPRLLAALPDDSGNWVIHSRAVPVPPGAQSLLLTISLRLIEPIGLADIHLDDLRLEPVAGLLLNQGRFLVTADWKTADGATGHAVGVELGSDSGYFWFFDPSNVELIVKVLDGCALNDRFWVFAGGLTNVGVELRVYDTRFFFERVYTNPTDTAYQPLQDTDALNACF